MKKENFKKALKENDMTMKEFSDTYNIPYQSVKALSRATKKKAKEVFKLK